MFLFGRDWLNKLQLNWKTIGCMRLHQGKAALNSFCSKYSSVFQERLGAMHQFKATLQVNAGTKPVFYCPRPTPFSIRDAIGKELNWLEQEGANEKIETREWDAPFVAVPKKGWPNQGMWRQQGHHKPTFGCRTVPPA